MSKPSPARPTLHFNTLDELLADVERLRTGYAKTGQWDLATMLDHLGKTINIRELAKSKPLFAPFRPIARFVIRQMIANQTYPTFQINAPKDIRPTPGVSIDAAYPHFVEQLKYLQSLPAEQVLRTIFGPMKVEEYVQLQLLHSAHHLSFLKPTA